MIKSSTDALVLEVEYAHPIDVVWRALTTDDAISQWLMPANGFQAEIGAKFTMAYSDGRGGRGGTVDCEVLEVDDPHRLTYIGQRTGQHDGDVSPRQRGERHQTAARAGRFRLGRGR